MLTCLLLDTDSYFRNIPNSIIPFVVHQDFPSEFATVTVAVGLNIYLHFVVLSTASVATTQSSLPTLSVGMCCGHLLRLLRMAIVFAARLQTTQQ